MAQMVIANRLADGLVVFLQENGDWVESISAGSVALDDAQAERLMEIAWRAEKWCLIVDPYLIEVEQQHDERRPTEFREAIRASGPTVRGGG